MTNEEQLELIKLKKENLRMQKALDDSQLHNLSLETIIEIVENSFGEKKIFRFATIRGTREKNALFRIPMNLKVICKALNYTRQAYYKIAKKMSLLQKKQMKNLAQVQVIRLQKKWVVKVKSIPS